MFPLRAIIQTCVTFKIHPNILTFVGVLINAWAAVHLAKGQFVTAGFIMIVANIFDFIDGKVATELGWVSEFGGFWDSVIDRISDIALFIGLIYLYSSMASQISSVSSVGPLRTAASVPRSGRSTTLITSSGSKPWARNAL